MTVYEATDYVALLRHVIQAADDDLPRWILADWLEEQDHPANQARARFIRAQLQAEQEPLFSEARWQALQRAEQLLPQTGQRWRAVLNVKVMHERFRRGFLHQVTMYSKTFVERGQEVLCQHPIQALRFVRLKAPRGTVPLRDLALCPHLVSLRELDLTGSELALPDYEQLGYSPHLTGLRRVALSGWNAEVALGLPLLLPAVPQLDELDVSQNPQFFWSDLEELSASAVRLQLRKLNLSGTTLTEGPFEPLKLFSLPWIQSIEQLQFNDSMTNPRSVYLEPPPDAALPGLNLRPLQLPRLKQLSLAGRRSAEWELLRLFRQVEFVNLLGLNLAGGRVQDRSIRLLAELPWSENLRVLNLRGTTVSVRAIRAFLQARPLCQVFHDFPQELLFPTRTVATATGP